MAYVNVYGTLEEVESQLTYRLQVFKHRSHNDWISGMGTAIAIARCILLHAGLHWPGRHLRVCKGPALCVPTYSMRLCYSFTVPETTNST